MDIREAMPFLSEDFISDEDFKINIDKILNYVKPISDEDLTMAHYIYSLKETNKTSGVYFIKNKYTGLMKIGSTSDIKNRYATLDCLFKNQFGAPDALKVVGFLMIHPLHVLKIEKMIHKELSDKRMYGEWFNVSEKFLSDTWLSDDAKLNNGVRITSMFKEDLYNIIGYKQHLPRIRHSISGILLEQKFIEWLSSNYQQNMWNNDLLMRAIYDISPNASSGNMLW